MVDGVAADINTASVVPVQLNSISRHRPGRSKCTCLLSQVTLEAEQSAWSYIQVTARRSSASLAKADSVYRRNVKLTVIDALRS